MSFFLSEMRLIVSGKILRRQSRVTLSRDHWASQSPWNWRREPVASTILAYRFAVFFADVIYDSLRKESAL
jgi:hypothetical protein